MNQALDNEEPKKQFEAQDIWADPDLAPLLFASQQNSTTEIAEESHIEDEEEVILESPDIQDPELAHQLYHKTLQPLLRKHLKGMTKEARGFIRQQVNLLLKDGHEKGRDGKQGYYYRMQQAVAIINKWADIYSTAMPPTGTKSFALFTMLKEKVDAVVASRTEKA